MSDPQQARIEAAAEAAAKEYRSHALRITDGGNNPTGEQIGCSCGAVFGGSFKAGKDHLHRTIATAVLAAADRVDPLRQPGVIVVPRVTYPEVDYQDYPEEPTDEPV